MRGRVDCELKMIVSLNLYKCNWPSRLDTKTKKRVQNCPGNIFVWSCPTKFEVSQTLLQCNAMSTNFRSGRLHFRWRVDSKQHRSLTHVQSVQLRHWGLTISSHGEIVLLPNLATSEKEMLPNLESDLLLLAFLPAWMNKTMFLITNFDQLWILNPIKLSKPGDAQGLFGVSLSPTILCRQIGINPMNVKGSHSSKSCWEYNTFLLVHFVDTPCGTYLM